MGSSCSGTSRGTSPSITTVTKLDPQRKKSNSSSSVARHQSHSTHGLPGDGRTPRRLRPTSLPGPNGENVAVPEDYTPVVDDGSNSMPIIASPLVVRIDGGDSSLSSGMDESGRLRPLDKRKYALVHIPNAMYPYELHVSPATSGSTTRPMEVPQEMFVPMTMPSYEGRLHPAASAAGEGEEI